MTLIGTTVIALLGGIAMSLGVTYGKKKEVARRMMMF